MTIITTIALFVSSSVLYAADTNTYGKKQYKDPITGMEFVFVKGGCYQMGDVLGDDEKPVHEVCVDDLYMGRYDVTQGQWKMIMGENPSRFSSCGDNCPVEQISWNDVQEFIGKLNSHSGISKYRLPTEAEWEYAARSGGKAERFAGGNDVENVAWYEANSRSHHTHPVGEKAANGLGLYDMSGNVWQWTSDWYNGKYYSNSPRNNPQGPSSGWSRVIRGGSWCELQPPDVRAARRRYSESKDGGFCIGVRLLRTP